MKIVILAAGRGTRFGENVPKPLIDVGGKTMLERVVENVVMGNGNVDDIIIVTHKRFEIPKYYNFKTIELDKYTEGPACTALQAMPFVNAGEELIIINCDQVIFDLDINLVHKFAKLNYYDAVLGVFSSDKPHNSYVVMDNSFNRKVVFVKEKVVVSNIATNGFHYWKKAQHFYNSCISMINAKDRVNNEFYISHSFNYLIDAGYRVGAYWFNMHYPIGTPEDLEHFNALRKV